MANVRCAVLVLAMLGSSLVLNAEEDTLVATTPHFAFHSDFETNLNDALIVAGSNRRAGRPALFEGDSEAADCFAELAPSARFGWNLAVDYYAEVISPAGWSGRQQFLIRLELAELPGGDDERSRTFTSIADGFRTAASPAYEACWWPGQNARDRAWVDQLLPLVREHGAGIGSVLEDYYGLAFHGLPLRVDVVAHAPSVGANSIWLSPEGGHILVSSTTPVPEALEMVFHEASHTMMRSNDPIQMALERAARELEMPMPDDLWHVVLFHTTGEAVRRTLDKAGHEDYVAMLYAKPHFWSGRWGRFRQPIEEHWMPYLDGRRTLDEAALRLLQSLME